MPSIEVVVPWILTIFFGCCTLYFSRKNLFRAEEHEIEDDSRAFTKVEIMLEQISNDVREIKQDNKSMQHELNEFRERLAQEEMSVKSLHKRLDRIEQKHYPE